MASTQNELDIAIVGAGIAGLAAAICLRRAGHKVTVYERSAFKQEVGAAINIPPHGCRILRAWGIASPEPSNGKLYVDSARGKKISGSRAMNFKSAEVTVESNYDGDEQTYGARGTSYHRADLHAALRRAAEDLGARIVLGQTATDIDCRTGTAVFVDSGTKTKPQTIKADLIVLADGVRSSFVETVTHQDVPLVQLGVSVFRMLIPVKGLLDDPETAILFQDRGEHFSARTLYPDTGVFTIAYPCRDGELMNVAIFHRPDSTKQGLHEVDWNTPANVADAEAALEGFHPAYKAMLKHADSVKVYPLTERSPLPTYVDGRAVLIGDAAHPMLPTVAGGGTTSLEDAATLEVLLKDLPSSDPQILHQRIALFDALRRPRDSAMQILSSTLLAPKPAPTLAPRLRPFYTGPLPDAIIGGSTRETREFLYPYDVYDVAKGALQWAEKEGFPEDMLMGLQQGGVVRHFGR